jgi:FKBP-type peptidyl-prolyl cis-trans isomerase FklB
MGYGNRDQTSSGIPPYSVLIFDLTLVDFSPAGQAMPAWSARQKEWID